MAHDPRVGLDVGRVVVGRGDGAVVVGLNVGLKRVPRGAVVGLEDGNWVQAPQSSAQLARTIASWQTFELSLRLMANVLMLVMHHCGWFVHELGKVCRDNTGQQRCGLGTMRQMTIQQRRPCAVTPRFATRACAGKEIDDGCTSAEWVREFVGESSFMKGSGKGRGDMYFSHPGGRSDVRDTAWHCSNNSVTRDLISIVTHPGGCHAR